MRKIIFLSVILICGYTAGAFAANDGLIINLAFAGERMGSHPNVVQVQIEGGFEAGSCHKDLAAVRKNDEHLIGALMAAHAAGKPIRVWLDQGDIYYVNGNRCVISYVIY